MHTPSTANCLQELIMLSPHVEEFEGGSSSIIIIKKGDGTWRVVWEFPRKIKSRLGNKTIMDPFSVYHRSIKLAPNWIVGPSVEDPWRAQVRNIRIITTISKVPWRIRGDWQSIEFFIIAENVVKVPKNHPRHLKIRAKPAKVIPKGSSPYYGIENINKA